MKTIWLVIGASVLIVSPSAAFGEIKVNFDHNDGDRATAAFKFDHVPTPSKNDAGSKAAFVVVTGKADANGAEVDALHDGKLPKEEDEPGNNFFFNAGTRGGRVLVDLGGLIDVKQVNTYSWHAGTRAPQVYKLYVSDGKASNFSAQAKQGGDPADTGWKLVATVDTRPKTGDMGGQYGVSISDSAGSLGQYRYLLFDISQTEDNDAFGNTFYSEIDVVDAKAVEPPEAASTLAPAIVKTLKVSGGKYEVTIDTTAAPELTDWTSKKLAPVIEEWYPKLVEMLPSAGYEAASRINVVFKPGRPGIPAATGANRITCNSSWFKNNLDGEAKGSVVHEMVHVVQHYGRVRGENATRPPGWLVEGIADYIRWFKFEPESHGAEITKRNISRARYDGNYRISANFLNWVSEKYDRDLVKELNASIREGKYNQELWKTRTGHAVEDLGAEWRSAMEKKVEAQ